MQRQQRVDAAVSAPLRASQRLRCFGARTWQLPMLQPEDRQAGGRHRRPVIEERSSENRAGSIHDRNQLDACARKR